MKSKLSIYFIAIIYFLVITLISPLPKNGFKNGGDSFGYHLYLPSIFIHHDVKTLDETFASLLSISEGYSENPSNNLGLHEANDLKGGGQVIKYTCGIAIINLPVFLLQYIYQYCVGTSCTGFEDCFAIGMIATSFCFILIGFVFIRKTLLFYFSDKVTSIALLGIAFGTNLFYMGGFQMPLSHTYLFGLYGVLLFYSMSFYKNPTYKNITLLAFAWGLIVLIRPNEIYSILIPALWGVSSLNDLKKRYSFRVLNRRFILLFLFIASIVGLPQFIYWKYVTSNWLYYSYGSEGFNFLKPELINGLFASKNGWLAYTPLMFLAIGYLIFDMFTQRIYSSISVFVAIHVYVVYSWWCWFYMGSYGSHPMVEIYPLLSLPLSSCIDYFLKSRIKKISFSFVFSFIIFLNISESLQFYKNMLISEAGSFAYRLNLLGKTKLTYKDVVLFDTKEKQPDKSSNIRTLYFNSFDSLVSNNNNIIFDSIKASQYLVMRHNDFCHAINQPIEKLNLKSKQWIKATIEANASTMPFNLYQQGSLMIEFYRGEQLLKSKELRIQNKIKNNGEGLYHFVLNQWGTVYFYSQIPDDIQNDDLIKVYIALFNEQAPDLKIDNFKVELVDNNRK